MNRWYWISAALAVVVIALGWWFLRPGSQDVPQSNTTNNFPQDIQYTGTTNQPGGAAKVSQDSLLSDPQVVKDPINKNLYFVGYHTESDGYKDPTATENPPYLITYDKSTNYFNISLLQEPLRQTREDAEQYLMQKTQYDYAAMCHLHYMLSVPNSVSQIYAGQNLGFSFCPGAVLLP